MKKAAPYGIALGITLVYAFLAFYLTLPAINIQSVGLYVYLLSVLLVYFFSVCIGFCAIYKNTRRLDKEIGRAILPAGIVFVVGVLVFVIGGISSMKLFQAKAYANLITVENAVFEEDMPETTNVTNIALMDSESAKIIGNRAMGSLSDVVSQYEIAENYTQINYKGSPKKVAPLEYVGWIKWMKNNEKGIPGYVMVDPVENSAEYCKFAEPLIYAPSACFGEDLTRKLRFDYPTKIFGSMYFELNDEGDPYYVVSCMKSNAGLFGAKDVAEVILFNPCTGESEICPVAETPSWVDIVYSGDLAEQKYNWYGLLSGGFWNSVFGNENCKQTTDDYGYITLGDDVWYFTGVTSITSDESNIGFIITNARTGAYKFYSVVGAEEYSAMGAAEGEVQEKGYKAAFPSLINVEGQATYIMVLKDSGGLVKMYALVNVENYSIVATGNTQEEAMNAYKKLLSKNALGGGTTEELPKAEITVADVRLAVMDGLSTVYITAEDGKVYKGILTNDESLILIRIGDRLTVTYEETEIEGLYSIAQYE